MYISDIKANDGHKSAILNYIKLDIFQVISLPETDITHNKVNNGLKLAILNLIKLKKNRAISLLHILFYS